MVVVKRDGRKEPIMFDKITARIRKLNYGLNPLVDPVRVAMRVIEGLYDGVTTSELDNLAAEIAATMTTTHPDYAKQRKLKQHTLYETNLSANASRADKTCIHPSSHSYANIHMSAQINNAYQSYTQFVYKRVCMFIRTHVFARL